ncbi:MAG: hypothetical protein JSS35_14155 [Proteobacteria bacterium]|nr:hypothetical protein [Pseudomonadota bacterium]
MDGTDQIEPDETDLLSEAAVARLKAHPCFRQSVEAFAAGALAEFEAQDRTTRWLSSALGRAALYLGAVLLGASPDGLTFARLAQMAADRGICSRGRVLAFTQYALATGRIVAQPSEPRPWARRPLALSPDFLRPIRARMTSAFAATAIVAPEVAPALERLGADAVIGRAVGALAALLTLRPELNRNPGGPLRRIFIGRDGGTRILQHLMLSQPPGRARLLEAAPLSRAELSRRFDVSRTHVNRLLIEAEAAGALTVAGGDRVEFSPGFSSEVEAYYAGMLQVNRMVAGMLMAEPD